MSKIIEIELPDGTILEFEGTQEAAVAAARKYMQNQQELQKITQQTQSTANQQSATANSNNMPQEAANNAGILDYVRGALNGVNQGVTMGWGDEIYGGLNALANAPSNAYQSMFGERSVIDEVEPESFSDLTSQSYERGRDFARRDIDETRSKTPITQGAAEVGSLLSAGALLPVRAGLTNIKALPMALRYPLSSTIRGAASGGATAAGFSEDPDNLAGVAGAGALVGGLLGGGLNATKQAGYGILKALPERVRNSQTARTAMGVATGGLLSQPARRLGGRATLAVTDRLPAYGIAEASNTAKERRAARRGKRD